MEKTIRTTDEIRDAILAYLEENEEVFNDVIEELDSYNGYLGDDRYYQMEELDEFYHDTDATEVLTRAFYGYDEEAWTTDASGNKTYRAFNPNRNYFRFNGYGNLVSADYKDYSAQLDRYAVAAIIEERDNLYINDAGIEALLDEYAEAEAAEAEEDANK